jgi:uncharacterized protein
VRRTALLLTAALPLLACQPPPMSAEPVAAEPEPEAEAEPEVELAVNSYWVGSLALPNNQSLDWALAITLPEDEQDPGAAVLWIPEQMLLRHPVGPPKLGDDGSLEISFAAVGATWTINPGRGSGAQPRCTFTQQGTSLDCDVEAVSADEFTALVTPARPQNPEPPFPYAIEQVQIPNPAAPGVTLAGTLTIPEGSGPHPAVVLISGSGLQDRDETIADHKPFWIIADHLSRQGFAVLRYDDRGFAESTGDGAAATMLDFASDAHAALEWLAEHGAVDGKRVGLIGHSEGGVIAPLLAAEHPKQVGFIVLLAGTGVTGSEIIIHQLGLIMRAGGADKALIEREQGAARALHKAVLSNPPEQAEAALAEVLRERVAELPEDERVAVGDFDTMLAAQVAALNSPWMRHFLAYDPIPALKRVKVPVLILFGDKDLQVDPEQNLAPMKKALGKNRAVEVVRFPGLNHLFQPATKGSPDEYAIIEQTIAVDVLERMTTWLRATTGLK